MAPVLVIVVALMAGCTDDPERAPPSDTATSSPAAAAPSDTTSETERPGPDPGDCTAGYEVDLSQATNLRILEARAEPGSTPSQVLFYATTERVPRDQRARVQVLYWNGRSSAAYSPVDLDVHYLGHPMGPVDVDRDGDDEFIMTTGGATIFVGWLLDIDGCTLRAVGTRRGDWQYRYYAHGRTGGASGIRCHPSGDVHLTQYNAYVREDANGDGSFDAEDQAGRITYLVVRAHYVLDDGRMRTVGHDRRRVELTREQLARLNSVRCGPRVEHT